MDTSFENVEDIKLIELANDGKFYFGKSNICGVGNTLFVIGSSERGILSVFNLKSMKKERAISLRSEKYDKIFGITCSETHLFIVYKECI
jgi:hypothetical protein